MMTRRPVDPGILLPSQRHRCRDLATKNSDKENTNIILLIYYCLDFFPPNPNTDQNMIPELKIWGPSFFPDLTFVDHARPAGSMGKQERERMRPGDTDTQGSGLLFLKVSPPLSLLGWEGRRMARVIDQSALTGTWLGGGMGVGVGSGQESWPFHME